MSLGQLLRDLRAKRSVTAVCRELGIASRQTIYTWEGPRSKPEPEELVRLMIFYGATQDQIDHALRLRAGLQPSAVPATPDPEPFENQSSQFGFEP